MPFQKLSSESYDIECTYINEDLLHEGNHLRLSRVNYLDPEGNQRDWEAITRVANPSQVAVTAITKYRRQLRHDVIVLVRQYRPALDAYTIEFPTGVLKSPEKDDKIVAEKFLGITGWHGDITRTSSSDYSSDPGCTSEKIRFVTVTVNGDAPENQDEQDGLQEDSVDLIMIPFAEIHSTLQRLALSGDLIDARVSIWSIGIQMGLKFAKDADIHAVSNLQASLPVEGNSVRTGLEWRLSVC